MLKYTDEGFSSVKSYKIKERYGAEFENSVKFSDEKKQEFADFVNDVTLRAFDNFIPYAYSEIEDLPEVDAEEFSYRFDPIMNKFIKDATFAYFESLENANTLSESLGDKLDDYQEWVDYDMKRFGKISAQTKREIEEAGLKIIKDKYGDWKVTA